MTNQTNKPTPSWVKRFDDKFLFGKRLSSEIWLHGSHIKPEAVKDFIRSELTLQREEIGKKLQKMNDPIMVSSDDANLKRVGKLRKYIQSLQETEQT